MPAVDWMLSVGGEDGDEERDVNVVPCAPSTPGVGRGVYPGVPVPPPKTDSRGVSLGAPCDRHRGGSRNTPYVSPRFLLSLVPRAYVSVLAEVRGSGAQSLLRQFGRCSLCCRQGFWES